MYVLIFERTIHVSHQLLLIVLKYIASTFLLSNIVVAQVGVGVSVVEPCLWSWFDIGEPFMASFGCQFIFIWSILLARVCEL